MAIEAGFVAEAVGKTEVDSVVDMVEAAITAAFLWGVEGTYATTKIPLN